MGLTVERPLEFEPQLYLRATGEARFRSSGPLFVSIARHQPLGVAGAALRARAALPSRIRRVPCGGPGPWMRPSLVSLASAAVTFVWGWCAGGSAYQAYYQLWRFLTALLVAALLLSVDSHAPVT